MDWLNYHHLLYFWVVAREGSITRATEKLRLAQPTISGQIRELERALGEKLFTRVGRNLVLTETGHVVLRYAEEIFSLGQELLQTLKGQSAGGRSVKIALGLADVVPKLIAHHLVDAVFALSENVQVTCVEGKPESLLAELAQHKLDVVISDSPIPPTIRIRAFNHLLGECGVTICGTKSLCAKYRRGFPTSLDGAPFLLPTDSAKLRRSVEDWFEEIGVRPLLRGEFDDSGLIKIMGQSGAGLFFVPSAMEKEVRKQYGVQVLRRVEELREQFYAISVERRFKNPGVIAISERARRSLFQE